MARALGIGGVFFRSPDPSALADWYGRWLGLAVEAGANCAVFTHADGPAGAYSVWSPFTQDTTYFDPSRSPFMVNLIVDDLDAALAQVREGGAEIVGEPATEVYGRFAWFLDPDGNKVELWQPPEPAQGPPVDAGA